MAESSLRKEDGGGFRRLLDRASDGDEEALARMLPLVYDELHRMASGYLRRERRDHTLQTTALVHEAYVRLAGQEDLGWKNRAHFRAIAATTMRRILIEHARSRGRKKRGEAPERVMLDDTLAIAPAPRVELQAIDRALTRLELLDCQQARIGELRFFADLSVEETAEVLSISKATVKRDWAMARAWLRRELEGGELAP
jgi:RNA polymerase sigma-70 factor, ECF subfamily